MGCLKKIAKLFILILIIFIFFASGGYNFVKDKYDEYTSPPRAVFVEQEKDFGDLSGVGADYSLSRSINFFGYRKLNALYLPKKQRITIFDLNSDNTLSQNDFKQGVIEEKLEDFLTKSPHFPMAPIEKIKITGTGFIDAGGFQVPYADFEANLKIIPLFKAKGTLALYKTRNRENIINKVIKNGQETSKLVISCKFLNGYEDGITKKFISQIKL